MIKPTIVITAKSKSKRLPGKNTLPLGSMPLTEHSLIAARQIPDANIIVSTDILQLKNLANKYGYLYVLQDPEASHKDVIEHALNQHGLSKSPCILLQPTSPFRTNNIIYKCWQKYVENPDKTVLTISNHHNAQIINDQLKNSDVSLNLWDGCVVIYPPNQVCKYSNIECVRNYHINSLQIDTQEDYLQACLMYEQLKPVTNVLSNSIYYLLAPIFRRNNITNNITLVTRPSDQDIPQNYPVAFVNHCLGYNNGRCDVLFLIANLHLKKVGISENMRICASKASIIIVRDNGELQWLVDNLPEIRGKFYPIREAISSQDDHLTTGCIAVDIMHNLGLNINLIGIYSPEKIQETLIDFHYPSMSRELALLYRTKIFDKN